MGSFERYVAPDKWCKFMAVIDLMPSAAATVTLFSGLAFSKVPTVNRDDRGIDIFGERCRKYSAYFHCRCIYQITNGLVYAPGPILAAHALWFPKHHDG